MIRKTEVGPRPESASTLVSAIRPKRGSRRFVGGGRMPPPACASAPPLPAPYGRARLRRDSHLDAMLVLDRLAESWVKSTTDTGVPPEELERGAVDSGFVTGAEWDTATGTNGTGR